MFFVRVWGESMWIAPAPSEPQPFERPVPASRPATSTDSSRNFGASCRTHEFIVSNCDRPGLVADRHEMRAFKAIQPRAIWRSAGQPAATRGVPSQSFTCPLLSDEAINRPSGLNATLWTVSEWPLRVISGWSISGSQSLIVWSSPAETIRVPSGLKATQLQVALSPDRTRICRPLEESQIRAVPSSARGDDRPPVWTVREAHDGASVPFQCHEILAGRRIPGSGSRRRTRPRAGCRRD